ncbi:alpha/beta fold hydrolase [Caulobacter sp. NIBR1757]|uniref:S9 family peptidase n=1 Tax=Caulobacter sp. NIBR1757 TaxID=3016000 RepID=UPI0022F0AF59|nr:alpha/beta fold hydrolase [Caulobacter sp. NIBR1757]WGM39940.1 Dipeptidyl aminopeptidase BIII [Caulobacter sp. NIBR1757]
MRKALILALALIALPAAAQGKREVGALVYDGAPETPAALKAAIAPYYNARSAVFEDWLPDGSMLIATRFGDTQQIHRVQRPGGDRTQLTFFSEPVNGAQAVPGAQRFLYPRDVGGAEYYQAFLRSLDGDEVQLTAPGTRNESFVFSKDGKTVVWSQVTPGKGDYDIMLAEVANPQGRRLVHKGTGAMSPEDISPDGGKVLLSRYISAAETRLFVLDLKTGAATPVGATDRKVAYSAGKFTADGQGLVLLSDDGNEVALPVVLDIASGAQRHLSFVDGPGRVRPPLWGAEALTLSPDRLTAAVATNEAGYGRVDLYDLAGGGKQAVPLPKGVLTGMGFSDDGRSLAISLSTSTGAGDVWSYDLASKQLTRWTNSELGGLQASQLVEPSLIHYATFDKRQIPAFVYRPTGPSTGKRPVIIQIHGGPEAQELPSFNPRRQSWVNEIGAVVIVPNVRGSSGYGKTYLSLDNAEKREDSVKDIGALLDWIATQPDLDASRVAVVGQSYGGYMSLAVAGRYNDRISGAIDLYGISDWVTFLENTEGYRRDLRRAEYGDERDPKMREVFGRISPRGYVSAMKKPMMVYQGANDPRVPMSESEAMVAQLRAQGTEVWYVLARDEGHGIARKSNQEQVRATEIVFLKKVLGVE